MKILNKTVESIKSLISKVRKPVHLEVHETSEKKVETVEKVDQVKKPVETSEKKAKPVETVNAVKRRGRPRKVKAE